MASKGATIRLKKEYKQLVADPRPLIHAKPLDENILDWHFVLSGPPDTPFSGGEYHGLLRFPSEYPFKGPGIQMFTPNGRFETNTRLCLSMSDFHPETWQISWTVGTILTGVLSFMTESTPTQGSIETSDSEKQRLAALSREWNRGQKKFVEVFPELV